MLLIRFLRNLLAVPFVLGASVAAMLSPAWSSRLWHTAWRVGLDSRHALQAAQQTLKAAGPTGALLELEVAIARTPCSLLWAFAGLVRLDAGDRDGAAACLDQTRALGSDPEGLGELLEVRWAYLDPQGSEAAGQLAESLETRRDVSSLVTRIALHMRAMDLLGQGRFDEAALRVERLLRVAHDPMAEVAGWAIDLHAGRREKARLRLARCADVSPANLIHLRCVTAAICGMNDELDRLRGELVERCTAEQVRYVDEIQQQRGAHT